MKKNADSHLHALLNLIQDDDLKVASLAMEQFLKLGSEKAGTLIAEYQEAADPRLRNRIHQLSSIFMHRRRRLDFIRGVRSQEMGAWEGLCRINSIYDPRCGLANVHEKMEALVAGMKAGRPLALPQIASIMREHCFAAPEEDVADIELYLAESVMGSCIGSGVLLSTVAYHAATEAGWRGSIGLHQGRFILVDGHYRILDPAAGWGVAHSEKDLLHPCAPRDLWMAVLTQLFMIALIEGHLRDIHHFGSLLATLNGDDISGLPQPLGQG